VPNLQTLERIRLDCDRAASHNLNRLLDKPGLNLYVVFFVSDIEISF
jgi:hypothetical protein